MFGWFNKWWLSHKLRSDKRQVREYAVNRLRECPEPWALQLIGKALKDPCEKVRIAAIEALDRPGNSRAVDLLSEPLHAQDKRVRTHAAQALSKIKNERVLELLIEAICRETDIDTSLGMVLALQASAKNLRKLTNPNSTRALVDALGHQEPWVRNGVAHVLAKLGWKPANKAQRLVFAIAAERFDEAAMHGPAAIPSLALALKTSADEQQQRAADALAKLGNAAVPALVEALRHLDQHVREVATKALGSIGDARAAPAMIPLLDDTYGGVRDAAVQVLSRMIDAPAVQAMASEFSNKRFDARHRRQVAIAVLARTGRNALSLLIEATSDEDDGIKKAAASALATCGNAAAARPLAGLLAHQTSDVSEAAVTALTRLGTIAIPALVTTLGAADNLARSKAAEILKKLKWQPSTPRERALFAVADGVFEQAAAEGEDAIIPLFHAAHGRWIVPMWSGGAAPHQLAAHAALSRFDKATIAKHLREALRGGTIDPYVRGFAESF